MSDVRELRAQIAQLHTRHAQGDLAERTFQKELGKQSLELYRASVEAKLDADEKILAEHHVVRAHMKLTDSVLRESEQEPISLFATDRRLIRVHSLLPPGQPPSCDARDKTVVDDVPYSAIERLRVCREVRVGEVVAGVIVVVIAIVFRTWLQITGTALILIGALGALHGLLLPSRWLEVRTSGATTLDPIRILALRKKSARKLVKLLKSRLAGSR